MKTCTAQRRCIDYKCIGEVVCRDSGCPYYANEYTTEERLDALEAAVGILAEVQGIILPQQDITEDIREIAKGVQI